MPRPRKNPVYDADKIIKELMAAVAESYEETGEMKITAEEFSMSALKVRKLLITAGAYSSEISDEINMLYIYPILYRFGIIEVPEAVADKMKMKKAESGITSEPSAALLSRLPCGGVHGSVT